MQPVQFQCGQCGQRMAVNSENLGQQVRCPHCQQVVVAPAPAPPALAPGAAEVPSPAPLESIVPPAAEDAEDIFSPKEGTDDLFGRDDGPRIEMPPPQSMPPPTSSNDAAPPSEIQAAPFLTLPWAPSEPDAVPPISLSSIAPSDGTAAPPPEDASPWPSAAISQTLVPPPADLPSGGEAAAPLEDESSAPYARSRRRTEQKTPWFLLLVFCPLLLYAIVISIFAFLLYREHQGLLKQRSNPFEFMPDVGDDPGVQKGKKVIRTDRYSLELATLSLPEHLCTTLGNPLRIGDLQVTPSRVERKRVSVIAGTAKPEPCRHDSLVLYLDMKNLSTEYAFAPLDNYFDRRWRPNDNMNPPLTQLEIGENYRCFGGPAYWYPRGDRSNNQRQWIEGRSDHAERLQPGEEKELFVCTDGDDDKTVALLFGAESGETYQGSLLWRVRVRRGLVRFQNKQYPSTAVIGVRFTGDDIDKAPSTTR